MKSKLKTLGAVLGLGLASILGLNPTIARANHETNFPDRGHTAYPAEIRERFTPVMDFTFEDRTYRVYRFPYSFGHEYNLTHQHPTIILEIGSFNRANERYGDGLLCRVHKHRNLPSIGIETVVGNPNECIKAYEFYEFVTNPFRGGDKNGIRR